MLSHCTGSLEAESQQDVEEDIKTQNPPRPTSSSEALPPEGPISFLNNITQLGTKSSNTRAFTEVFSHSDLDIPLCLCRHDPQAANPDLQLTLWVNSKWKHRKETKWKKRLSNGQFFRMWE